MSCIRWLIAITCACVLFVAGCGRAVPPVLEATLDETGLHIELDPAATLDSLALLLADGTPVQTWQGLPRIGRTTFPLAVNPGATYVLQAVWRGEDLPVITLHPPVPSDVPFTATIGVLGHAEAFNIVPPEDEAPIIVVPSGDLQLVLTITHASDIAGTAILFMPDALLQEPQGSHSQFRRIPLELNGQQYTETMQMRLGADAVPLRFVAQFESETPPGQREWATEIILEPITPEKLAGLVTLNDAYYPAPRKGGPPNPVSRNQVWLPNAFWSRIAGTLGLPAQHLHPDRPVGSTHVDLRNNAAHGLPLVISASVTEIGSDVHHPNFAPSEWIAAGGTAPQVARLQTVPPGDTTIDLPLYVRPAIRSGDYTLHVRGTVLGTDAVVFSREILLQVRHTSSWVTAVLMSAFVVALLSLGFLRRWYIPLMRSYSAAQLMRIATLAAVLTGGAFVLGMGNVVLAGLLGPFNVFAGEIISEIWIAMIITVGVMLLPRVGTFALLYLTNYLLRGLLAGQLQIADFLIVGSTVGLMELALWLCGATRAMKLLDRFTVQPWMVGLLAALALGIADALLTGVQLAIGMGFYRLMYAPWYIAASIAITGFGATAIGVLLALPLAAELRRIHA